MNCTKCNKLLTNEDEYVLNGEVGYHIVCPKEEAMKHTCDICCPTELFGKPVAMKEALDTLKDLESPTLSPSEREWFDRLGQGTKFCPCGVGIGSDTAIWIDNYPTEWIREHYQHCSITYPTLPAGAERWQILGINTPVNPQPQWLRDYLQHKDMKHKPIDLTEPETAWFQKLREVAKDVKGCPCGSEIRYDAGLEAIKEWVRHHYAHVSRIAKEIFSKDMNKINKDDVVMICGQYSTSAIDERGYHRCPESQSLLSILFFVTGDAVFAKVESSTTDFGDKLKDAPGLLRSLYSNHADWRYTSFDQIKADIEAFTAQLGAKEKPVPRLERYDDDKYLFVIHHGGGGEVWREEKLNWLCTLFGNTPKTYEPQQHEAVWTQLYPFNFTEAHFAALCNMSYGQDAFRIAYSLQSESFSVWRCEIVVK